MHTRILAERNEAAHRSIVESAGILAERLKLSPDVIAGLTATHRDPAIQALFQREAVAALLESVVGGSSEPAEPEDEEPPLLLSEAQVSTDPAHDADDTLPQGFPSREVLIAGGFESLELLKAATKDDLMAIDGIGSARADQIMAALAVIDK